MSNDGASNFNIYKGYDISCYIVHTLLASFHTCIDVQWKINI